MPLLYYIIIIWPYPNHIDIFYGAGLHTALRLLWIILDPDTSLTTSEFVLKLIKYF